MTPRSRVGGFHQNVTKRDGVGWAERYAYNIEIFNEWMNKFMISIFQLLLRDKSIWYLQLVINKLILHYLLLLKI